MLNVLVARRPSRDFAVHWHRDATLGFSRRVDEAPPLAKTVTVLYLNAPASRGELLLRRPKRPPWRACWRRRATPSSDYVDVDAAVAPKENRLVVFHGEAEHAVASFDVDAERADEPFQGARVSLVLEQYAVPSRLRDALLDLSLIHI